MEFTLTNDADIPHSMDFHAAQIDPKQAYSARFGGCCVGRGVREPACIARIIAANCDQARCGRSLDPWGLRASVSVKVDPLPGVLSTASSPPMATARSRLIARPSPVPA